MKKGILKICSLAISLALVMAMASMLVACGHEHTFATEWKSDATNHWHAATCEHTDEVADKAAHTFSGEKCTVCGYEKPHEHTYATTWSSDETNHWHAATCGHTNEKKDSAAHTFDGRKCTVCDYEKKVESKCKCDTPCVVCPECGGCIDISCKNDECEKCGEGKTETLFEVESAELNFTPDIIDRSTTPEKGGCVFIQGLMGSNGSTMKFTITSNKATVATLKVGCAKNGKKVEFTKDMTVLVNGEIYDSESYVNPNKTYANEVKRDFELVTLGCIELIEGENTIEIIVATGDPQCGFNMNNIALLTEEGVTLTWNPIDRSADYS